LGSSREPSLLAQGKPEGVAALPPRTDCAPMATIYPEHQRYHGPESDAERRLYPLLAELPDDHVVFRNRRWHVRSRSGGAPKPAEADFLIAHPDRGILVLEVKGGVIRRDVTTDRWYSNAALLDPDPFQQVQRTRYLLVEMLEAGPSSGIGFPAGEAVAFPDGFIDRSDVSDALLPERIIGGEELEHLDAAIERCFDAFGLHDKAATFGRRGVRALTEAVAGGVNVRRHIGRRVREAEAELVELTEAQYAVLDQLDGNRRMCVLGGAGTGKTLLAMERERRPAGAPPAAPRGRRSASDRRTRRPRRARGSGGDARGVGTLHPGPSGSRQDVHRRSARRRPHGPRPPGRRSGHVAQGHLQAPRRDRDCRRRGRRRIPRPPEVRPRVGRRRAQRPHRGHRRLRRRRRIGGRDSAARGHSVAVGP
jgi:hypothetical protein